LPCPGFFQTQTEAARAEHGQADNAVRAVVDVIADLGDEVQVVDARTESALGEGVACRGLSSARPIRPCSTAKAP
jgi:hypothetical protein